jgi:hypothetical protein
VYFRQQEWEEEWIDNAENLVREEYILNYEGKHNPTSAPDTTNSVSDLLYVILSTNQPSSHRSMTTTTTTTTLRISP